ncbi:hypothetical protein [Streptomyces sp. NPDC005805]|uniref:hypothetical protein n=1 Tax=Streptomyces sp. NPDC005805 TaxID=3157068 RepID=UPI003409DB6D
MVHVQVEKYPNGLLTFDGTYIDGLGQRLHIGSVTEVSYRPARRWVPGASGLLVLRVSARVGMDRANSKLLVRAAREAELRAFVAALEAAREAARD